MSFWNDFMSFCPRGEMNVLFVFTYGLSPLHSMSAEELLLCSNSKFTEVRRDGFNGIFFPSWILCYLTQHVSSQLSECNQILTTSLNGFNFSYISSLSATLSVKEPSQIGYCKLHPPAQ